MKQSIMLMVMLAFSFSASYSQVETKFFEKKNATASLKRLSAIKQAIRQRFVVYHPRW